MTPENDAKISSDVIYNWRITLKLCLLNINVEINRTCYLAASVLFFWLHSASSGSNSLNPEMREYRTTTVTIKRVVLDVLVSVQTTSLGLLRHDVILQKDVMMS